MGDFEDISYDFKTDPEIAPLLRLLSQTNGKLPNFFHNMSKHCMKSIDNLMSYSEIFGKEMSPLTVRSHLLVFYYCMSEPLISSKLREETQKCLLEKKHSREIIPCANQIMLAKKIADKAIFYAAQLEDEAQQKRDQGSFFEGLENVQNNCLKYMIQHKICSKFLEQCEKDMLEVTPTMHRKCTNLEQQGLECVQNAFCKREQKLYSTCVDRTGDADQCIKEHQQLTICGETYQSMARVVGIKKNKNAT
jgi:hypothetical protein